MRGAELTQPEAAVPAISAGLLLHAFDGGPARGLGTVGWQS